MVNFGPVTAWAALCAAIQTIFVPMLHAAELVRSASVFEDADQGSKQVLILKKGQQAKVTGASVDRDDRTWLPVTINGKSGWAEAETLRLTEGDVGYLAPDSTSVEEAPKHPLIRYWFGLGPTLTSTSGYTIYSTAYSGETYGGAAVAGGVDALIGKEGRWPLGVRIFFPWINERSQGFAAGRITRVAVLPEFGYALIPQRLELMAHLGLTYIKGQSSNFDSKLAITPGITLALQLSSFEPGSLYQAVELGGFKIAQVSGSISDATGIGSGFCSILGAAFGSPDPSCTPGVAPAAYVFTLLYKIGGQL